MVASIFETLTEKLSSVASANNQLKSLKKEDIEDLIDISISSHKDIENFLSLKFDKKLKEWSSKVTTKLDKENNPLKDIFSDFASKLKNKAQNLSRESIFTPLKEANKTFREILTNIRKDIDKFFTDDEVEIYNMKLSLISLIGLLNESDLLYNYSAFMFTFFIRAGINDDNSIPRYRHKFLLENTGHVAEIVNELCDKKGNATFLKNIENLQKKGLDLTVSNRGKFGINNYADKEFFGSGIISLFSGIVYRLNIFAALFDWMEDYKRYKYERNKETAEWLRAHVAALKMELETYDPNSRNYVKLLNVIRSYDVMISELDEKLLDYEEE